MIACIHQEGHIQILAGNKQRSPNLRIAVESYINKACRYGNHIPINLTALKHSML